ncbi:unnamed protein product [Calicophoron daubneyi]|uniref:Cystatin domain-containing protein n=1 Tax=Calicophoron daubneyi TaxID=300641 RepID=A0AAV2TLE8_CALDB
MNNMLLSFVFFYFTLVWATGFEGRSMMVGGFIDAQSLEPSKVEELRSFLSKNLPGHDGITDKFLGNFEIRRIETQVVAGTNYRVHLKAGNHCITAVIWEKLPVYGGDKELLSVDTNCPA